jgi:hypothetical protein
VLADLALGETILASSSDEDGGERVSRYIAVDLPGHGESPPRVCALFGELMLADYVAALLGTLDRLKALTRRSGRAPSFDGDPSPP